jgi:pyruvate/2-oxoglutarate dehydrogenase complex dihydrolipoamide acyltransferase (E2) component
VSRLRRAVHLAHITVLLGISLSASAATAPNPADLARCAGIAAPDARLACYDALSRSAERAVPAATATPAPAPASGTTPPPAAAAAAAAATATPTAPALPSAPPSTPASASDARNFGLTQAQVHKSPEGPAAIEAHIAKIINNPYARDYVVLDNGQTWTYTDSDEDARLAPGDQVTIKRASLGSFLMRTPSKHAYHVRRTH